MNGGLGPVRARPPKLTSCFVHVDLQLVNGWFYLLGAEFGWRKHLRVTTQTIRTMTSPSRWPGEYVIVRALAVDWSNSRSGRILSAVKVLASPQKSWSWAL